MGCLGNCGSLFRCHLFCRKNLPSELAPLEDRSSIRFQMTGPEGASFNYMNDVAKGLTDYLADSIPEKAFVFASIPGFSGNGGVNGGTARIALVDPDKRKRSQSDIVKLVTKNCHSLTTQEYSL